MVFLHWVAPFFHISFYIIFIASFYTDTSGTPFQPQWRLQRYFSPQISCVMPSLPLYSPFTQLYCSEWLAKIGHQLMELSLSQLLNLSCWQRPYSPVLRVPTPSSYGMPPLQSYSLPNQLPFPFSINETGHQLMELSLSQSHNLSCWQHSLPGATRSPTICFTWQSINHIP